jgi:hypothetical protein
MDVEEDWGQHYPLDAVCTTGGTGGWPTPTKQCGVRVTGVEVRSTTTMLMPAKEARWEIGLAWYSPVTT